jgi:hypothetical protein
MLEFTNKVCNELLYLLSGEVVATKSSNVDDLYKLLDMVQISEGVK